MIRKTIADLLELQTVDLRIRDLNARLASLPAERNELVAEFAAEKAKADQAQNNVRQTELKLKTAEGDLAAKQQHLLDVKIRSASVKKLADYNAVNADIAATEKAIGEIETEVLNLMESLDSVKLTAEKAAKSFRAASCTIKTEALELEDLKKQIELELAAKQAEAAEKEKNVSATWLPVYRRMLAKGKGIPVGAIKDGLCPNCNIRLTPSTLNNAVKGDLVYCDSCSFLLYDPDANN